MYALSLPYTNITQKEYDVFQKRPCLKRHVGKCPKKQHLKLISEHTCTHTHYYFSVHVKNITEKVGGAKEEIFKV